MANAASRSARAERGYIPPSSAARLGLSSPVPAAMRIIPAKTVHRTGRAIALCPSMMRTAP
jgi:hypothetical protein